MRVNGIRYVQARNAYTDSDGKKYGIAIHATANTASAAGEAAYMTRRTDGISCHLVVDGVEVIQTLDTNSKAGHAGSSQGNENAIAVECVGQISWSRQKWLDSIVWAKLAAALAQIIKAHWPDGSFRVRRASVAEMKSNPKVKAFYGHNDMRLAWAGTTHTDPGPNFPWDRLLAAVTAALEGEDVDGPSTEQMQEALKANGWYDGEIDGDWGPKSQAALVAAFAPKPPPALAPHTHTFDAPAGTSGPAKPAA